MGSHEPGHHSRLPPEEPPFPPPEPVGRGEPTSQSVRVRVVMHLTPSLRPDPDLILRAHQPRGEEAPLPPRGRAHAMLPIGP